MLEYQFASLGFRLTRLQHDNKLLVHQLRTGDVRALARAISTVENRAPGWSDLLKALFPHTGHARVIGLTGAPGAGKSTLVDQLARLYRSGENPYSSCQERGLNGAPDARNRAPDAGNGVAGDNRCTVGIIAVDPTSPYTGGAILGDRIRMQEHFSDPGIFIRSMATRGSLGGLARTTADVATVLDASGRDIILIETVGVGQDEIEIVRLADITVVILVPGMGDDVQTIKAGIMEIADIFVINKSDREGADRVEREVRALQSLDTRHDGWTPPIVKTVASEGKGIKELARAIADYESYLQKEDRALKKSAENWQERLIEMLRDAMLEKAREQLGDGNVARLAAEVAEHKRDPYTLVEEIAGKINT
ncbi:MAG: methylmalonyl Co-A mutase-associated GTPase MeaB [Candidatus Sulfotelmatobacter sp.]